MPLSVERGAPSSPVSVGVPIQYVVFSSAYWDDPIWTNKQHVASRLAVQSPVLYVEPGFSRSILKKRMRKLAWRELHPVRELSPQLTLLSPWFLLFRRGATAMRNFSFKMLAQLIQSQLKPGHRIVLLVYHPAGVKLLDHFKPDLVVYDCVDHLQSQPHYSNNPALRDQLVLEEELLFYRSQLVLCTSRALHERNLEFNGNSVLLENVGDFWHFNKAADWGLPVPDKIGVIPRPRIGFAGALDPYKLDYKVLYHLAKELPKVSLVLIGPEKTVDENQYLAQLRQLPNVYHLGLVSYQDMPYYLKEIDVILLPYPVSEHTKHVFPLKFFEALATGKPVVVSDLPSIRHHLEVCRVASRPEEWKAEILDSLSQPELGRDARLEKARQHTWEKRVGRIQELVAAELAKPRR